MHLRAARVRRASVTRLRALSPRRSPSRLQAGSRVGRRALRAEGHPRRRPAAHRARHRVRVAAVSHRRHLQRREGRRRAARAVRDRPVQGRAHRDRGRRRWSSSSKSARSSPTSTSSACKEFDKDALTKSLKDFGIGEGLPFDKALADRAEQELKRQYLTRSLYGAEVVTTVTPHRAQPRQRHVHGHRGRRRRRSARSASSATRRSRESTLKGLFDLNDRRLAHLVHQVRPLLARQAQRRPRDAARLLPEPRLPRVQRRVDAGRDLARQAGHHDHDQRQAKASRYTVTGVKLEGDYLGKEDEFKSLVHDQARRAVPRRGGRRDDARPSPTASAPSAMRSPSVDAAPRDRPRQRPGRRSRCVADPQRRVYVRRINVAGNTRTRDEVVRREFRQFESSLVRRPQDQALARPRRPPRLLQRSQRRHRRGARARPTRST